MQLPFDLNDVRMLAIDGNVIRFVLPAGHVEMAFNSREEATQALATPGKRELADHEHVMFEDGIYGF
jgi:hypothetical protein